MKTKPILITGGTRGLGLSICRKLLKSGYEVVAAGRTKSDELSQLIESHHETPSSGSISFERIDLADCASLHSRINEISKKARGLYGLVNNAAIGKDGVLATMHDSEIHDVIRVNIEGSIIATKYAIRSMLLRGEGRVVNIASIIATTGFNGLSVYGASKAALLGFSQSLARELGKANITVNSVLPGYMKTDMTSGLEGEKLKSILRRSPLGRLATTDDVAETVDFLLSHNASSITGAQFKVDAGSTC